MIKKITGTVARDRFGTYLFTEAPKWSDGVACGAIAGVLTNIKEMPEGTAAIFELRIQTYERYNIDEN